ncbi:GAF domain-containing protein [Gemmatimonadota bacterium]
MTNETENIRQELDAAYRQLEQTASRLLLINQAGMLTASTHEERVIGRELLESVLDSIFASRGLVITYSQGGTVFDILADQGLDQDALDDFKRSESDVTALWIASLRKVPITRQTVLEAEEWESGLTDPGYAVYVPLFIENELTGALVVGDKTTGEAFDDGELAFLASLGHHTAVALNHALLFNQLEKRLRDLDTLLKISQEITSTLDLDRILKTMVTMASALAELKYCAIGMQKGSAFNIDEIGGEKPDKEEQASLKRLMEYVVLADTEIAATLKDLPEGAGLELFQEHFEATGTKSFWGVPLKDDQGIMGAYCQLGTSSLPGDEELELLRIMANQASVAIRNAELYHQVPFISFLEPLMEKRRKLWEAGRKRMKTTGIPVVLALAALLLVKVPYRTGGTAVVYPGERLQLRAPISGVVEEVFAREGDVVGPDHPVGKLRNLETEMRYRDVEGALDKAIRDEAAARARSDHYAAQQAAADREALQSQLELLSMDLAATMITPPWPAIVITPHVEEREGDFLASGDVFCEVGTLHEFRVEIALPERDWYRVELGQSVKLKFYAYVEQTFDGAVDILAPTAMNTRDGKRVLIATSRISAPMGVRPGMTGVGKVQLGRRSLFWFVARPFVRFVALRWWS